MNPSISLLFFGFLVAAYFYLAWHIWKLYRKASARGDENATPLGYFLGSFISMGIFFVFHWLPLLALYIGGPYASYENFQIAHPWSHLTGHIFMHISFAFMGLVGAHFSWPRLKAIAFGWPIFWGVIVGTPVTILYPQVTEITGPIMTGGDSPIVGVITMLGALSMLFTGIVFFYHAFKRGAVRIFRVRSLLLGIGLILFLVAGPMNDSAATLEQMIPAYAVTLIMVFLTAIPFFLGRGEFRPAEKPAGA